MKKDFTIEQKISIELFNIDNNNNEDLNYNDCLNKLVELCGTNEIISLEEYDYSYELIYIDNKDKLDKLFRQFNDSQKYLIICFDSNNMRSYIHLNSNNKKEIIREFKTLQKQLNKIEKGIC